MSFNRLVAALVTFAVSFAILTFGRGAGLGEMWIFLLLVAWLIVTAIIFWGDVPNGLIAIIAGIGIPAMLWLSDAMMDGSASKTIGGWTSMPFWAIFGVIFWKGASTIRVTFKPWEYNLKYRLALKRKRTIRELHHRDYS